MSALRRRAFFYPRPIASEPGGHQGIISFPGLVHRILATPAPLLEQGPYVVGMIGNPECPLNDLVNARQGPLFRRKSGRTSPSLEERQQLPTLPGPQPRRTTRGTASAEPAQAAVLEAVRPLADRGAADA